MSIDPMFYCTPNGSRIPRRGLPALEATVSRMETDERDWVSHSVSFPGWSETDEHG